MNWKAIRNNYPLVNRYTYLDTARTGSMSEGTAQALKAHIDDFVYDGALHRETWIEIMESARARMATVLEARPSEIGFVTDVSTGMSLLATALKQYKRVLLVRDDFPSVGIPWIRSGYEITWIDKEQDGSIDLARIEEALKSGIDLLSISWVQYNTGFRIDLEALGALCERYNTKLVVDGTQGFYVFPMNPAKLKIDIFLASCFKWVTGGYGISVVFIDASFRQEIDFQAGGWNSLIDFFGTWEEEHNYKPGVDLMELGHPKYANLYTLNHALGELEAIGIDAISEKVSHLSRYLQTSLEKAGIETRSNYAPGNFSGIRIMGGGSKELFKRLLAEKVMVTFREDYFRVAPHFYNEEADIDRLISCATA